MSRDKKENVNNENKAVIHKGGQKNIFGQSEKGQERINKEAQDQKPKKQNIKG